VPAPDDVSPLRTVEVPMPRPSPVERLSARSSQTQAAPRAPAQMRVPPLPPQVRAQAVRAPRAVQVQVPQTRPRQAAPARPAPPQRRYLVNGRVVVR
ncbi:MAG: hypothetical protein Q8M26_02915, partial [Pseudolabrys sp.]|nr:hypothetical protein [Pseudolabrys sp.]